MKLDIIFHYDVNTTTGEIQYIGKEEVTVDTKKSTKATTKTTTKVDDNPDPIVTLDSNKLVLTKGAMDLLKVCEDCRIDVKYTKKDKKAVPVIGCNTAFGTQGGNTVTKSNTVSFRGAKNEKLASYGTVFKLEPTEEDGIFYLVSDKKEEEIPQDIVDIEKELDNIDDLTIDIDETQFDFKL